MGKIDPLPSPHRVNIGEYRGILALIFTVEEINRDPDLLPNVTLGYHIFDTCGDPSLSVGYVLQILSGYKMEAPNYSCREREEVAGFIGDTTFPTSHVMAQLLSLYQYTQINYVVTDPLLSKRELFPTLYRLMNDDQDYYGAVITCLLHFGWNFVGMVSGSDVSNGISVEEFGRMMTRHGICVEYAFKLKEFTKDNVQVRADIEKATANVVIFCGLYSAYTFLFLQDLHDLKKKNTFILHGSWTDVKYLDAIDFQSLNCSLLFLRPQKLIPHLDDAINNASLFTRPTDPIMEDFADSESCFKCPDEEWPDEKNVRCVPRVDEFLSYDDVLALVFSLASLTFSSMTIFILGNFIYFWGTLIVKANNRTVSFILLTSILLSFLCVFLFLGCPVDITCLLRQVAFAVFFSISVSCLLAKTVTVCIAFKTTKPGSYWKRLVTVKLSNSLVVICSSVQILICTVWLSVSPPYKEYDMSSPGKIIIQCNEGSVIGFYSVLGYMGFLAAVSFLLAFMVRTLPDSFNEAKYITFSMLVFCSVWIAMIPAYLSTRGKYMVAVEVFAILASCAGILGCIFLPKCYIIHFKPELNSRRKTCYKL
ncbi:vomeronasal type-2 receptor 26-like [Hyperolius riggenbachi]|uniref:vomeronasal type-2 receptor 26-like n=1 Tax=Hyperolius riggenbachi TaxID=752182 RepID=UPI0035A38DC7